MTPAALARFDLQGLALLLLGLREGRRKRLLTAQVTALTGDLDAWDALPVAETVAFLRRLTASDGLAPGDPAALHDEALALLRAWTPPTCPHGVTPGPCYLCRPLTPDEVIGRAAAAKIARETGQS